MYCTQADIEASLVSLRDLKVMTNGGDASATTVNTTVLATQIQDADSEIDAYIGVRYELPLSTVPVLIIRLSARITRYKLYTARGGEPEEWIKQDYEQCRKLLQDISKGVAGLGLTEDGETPDASAVSATAVRATSAAPVFGRTNLKGF